MTTPPWRRDQPNREPAALLTHGEAPGTLPAMLADRGRARRSGLLAILMAAACAPAPARTSTARPRPAPVAVASPPRPIALGGGSVAVSDTHSCAQTITQEVACWGANEHGQLGRGTISDREVLPAPIPAFGGVVALAVGEGFSCARRRDGSVWCWGELPGSRRLFEHRPARTSPEPVPGLVGVTALVAAGRNACALDSSRHVLCWGDNAEGQVGDGTRAVRPQPVPVPLDFDDAAGVALSTWRTCAWSRSGDVTCWGLPFDGSGAERRTAPRALGSIPTLRELVLGGRHACVRLDEGTVSCWRQSSSQDPWGAGLPDRMAPIPGLSDAVEVAAGLDFACARTRGGTVVCWAFDVGPELLGLDGERHRPRVVPGIEAGTSIALGAVHACLRRADGRVACWGANDSGQLGDGSTRYRAAPRAALVSGEMPEPEPVTPVRSDCRSWSDCVSTAQADACVSREPGEPVQPLHVSQGLSCDCEAGRCQAREVAPVPCRTDRDCWFTTGTPIRAIGRPHGLRRTFRPCVDGERPPACVMGACGFGMPYPC